MTIFSGHNLLIIIQTSVLVYHLPKKRCFVRLCVAFVFVCFRTSNGKSCHCRIVYTGRKNRNFRVDKNSIEWFTSTKPNTYRLTAGFKNRQNLSQWNKLETRLQAPRYISMNYFFSGWFLLNLLQYSNSNAYFVFSFLCSCFAVLQFSSLSPIRDKFNIFFVREFLLSLLLVICFCF